MNCRIDAWLDQGNPCIRITDTDSGRICMQWSLRGKCPPADAAGPCNCDACPAGDALHGLVRELFLLACMDRVSRQKGPPLSQPGLHGKLNGHIPLEGMEPFGIAEGF